MGYHVDTIWYLKVAIAHSSFMVDLSMKYGDFFHSYVSLPEGNHHFDGGILTSTIWGYDFWILVGELPTNPQPS